MSRPIDADELEELFREVIGHIAKKPEMNGAMEHMVRASAMVVEMIHDAPTIEPRKKGKWVKQNPMVDTEKCSECGYNIQGEELETPFCPWCGADMRGEQDEQTD